MSTSSAKTAASALARRRAVTASAVRGTERPASACHHIAAHPVTGTPEEMRRAFAALAPAGPTGRAVATGLTGLWIGAAPPAGVETLMATFAGTTQTVSLATDTEALLFEELSDG